MEVRGQVDAWIGRQAYGRLGEHGCQLSRERTTAQVAGNDVAFGIDEDRVGYAPNAISLCCSVVPTRQIAYVVGPNETVLGDGLDPRIKGFVQ